MKFDTLAKLLLIKKLKDQVDRLDNEQSSQAASNDVSINQITSKIAILDNELQTIEGLSKEEIKNLKGEIAKLELEEKKRADQLVITLDERITAKYDEQKQKLVSEVQNLIRIPKDGLDGLDGLAGKDGKSITSAKVDNGELIIAIDGIDQNLGSITSKGERGDQGEQGEKGEPGVGVKSADIISGQLVLRMTDDTVYELGNVVGPQGPKGDMPKHQWDKTKLRFEKPDGRWGKWVDLRGPRSSGGGASSIGQPIITKVATQNDGTTLTSDTRTLNFAGDLVATKTGTNSVTVSVDASGSFITWYVVNENTQMLPFSGYIASSPTLIDLKLPSECAIGQLIKVMGFGAGKFRITQNEGQQIYFGNVETTAGLNGSILATQNRNTLELIKVSDTIYMVASSVGNFVVN